MISMCLSVAPRPSSSSTAQNCFSGRHLNHHKENQQEWPGKRVTLLEVVFSFSLLYNHALSEKNGVNLGDCHKMNIFLKDYNNKYVLYFLYIHW